MKLLLAILVPVVLGSSLALSCVPDPVPVLVFNNSGSQLLLFVYDRGYRLSPGDSQQIDLYGDFSTISVYLPRGRFEYLVFFDELTVDFQRLIGGEYRIQIEPDLRAFILEKRTRPPVDTEKMVQPPGFPLVPKLAEAWSAT